GTGGKITIEDPNVQEAIPSLLNRDPDILNAQGFKQATLSLLATEKGIEEKLQQAIQKGVDVSEFDEFREEIKSFRKQLVFSLTTTEGLQKLMLARLTNTMLSGSVPFFVKNTAGDLQGMKPHEVKELVMQLGQYGKIELSPETFQLSLKDRQFSIELEKIVRKGLNEFFGNSDPKTLKLSNAPPTLDSSKLTPPTIEGFFQKLNQEILSQTVLRQQAEKRQSAVVETLSTFGFDKKHKISQKYFDKAMQVNGGKAVLAKIQELEPLTSYQSALAVFRDPAFRKLINKKDDSGLKAYAAQLTGPKIDFLRLQGWIMSKLSKFIKPLNTAPIAPEAKAQIVEAIKQVKTSETPSKLKDALTNLPKVVDAVKATESPKKIQEITAVIGGKPVSLDEISIVSEAGIKKIAPPKQPFLQDKVTPKVDKPEIKKVPPAPPPRLNRISKPSPTPLLKQASVKPEVIVTLKSANVPSPPKTRPPLPPSPVLDKNQQTQGVSSPTQKMK
ncbi:MAG: hypothetical protein ACNA7Y_01635, partial [Gammaproteobacteria bacterium]